ncbi:TonB-dependent receptor [Neptunitalea chrysea]|uniref:TonB-dependent receptor n=1 Tax=Neptunitalea chrysea TaxID=1647581 RepID=A0A9W6B3G4_9FLAO|nr:TonB-dependent receptor [Neptunitalea chrysea]GLB51916.1 TonB-dependent receptor [Neptunitalea chrysea]
MLIFFMGYSQQSKSIKVYGTVVDKDTKEPLEYATLVLQNVATNNVTGGVTDMNGKFNVEAPAGTYNIRLEFISYKSYQLSNQNLTTDKDMGTITLALDVAQLDAVEVTADKTTVELRLDKKVYNVGSDMTVKGGAITDVLDNVPSVSVDVEGGISLRGNDNVRILINGKPSALSGLDNAALQQLPADAIEKVEVITNPSSRYDAEGTAGIINIILKQGKALGVNGSVNAFAGNPDNFGGGFNLNFRTKHFNIFTNSSYRYRKGPGEALFEQENYNDDGTIESYQNEYRDYDRMGKNWNNNIGIEVFIDSTSSFTNSFVYSKGDGEDHTNIDFLNYDENRDLVAKRNRFTVEGEDEKSIQYSFNYEKRFKTDGHKLTVDYQYSESDEIEDSTIDETNLTTSTQEDTERTVNDQNQKKSLLQADYVLPFGKEFQSQLEAGYRGNFNKYLTDYQYGIMEDDGTFTLNYDYTNVLDYRENINAAYAQLGTKLGKWNLLGGLRMESTDIDITLVNTNETSNKKYTNLFPSVFLGYEFSEKTQATISYSRRLRRPWSRFINPFPTRSSNTNFFQGNPDLDPTFTNAFDLGLIKRWDKFTLNTSAYYNHSTQVFQFVSQESGEFVDVEGTQVPVMLRYPINLATEDRWGVEFTTTYNPFKKWRLSSNINIFQQTQEGDFVYTDYLGDEVTQNFDSENFSWFARISSKLTLPAAIDFQTNMMYRGPNKSAQRENKGQFHTNLAFSKDVFKENATISLNVSDLFNTRIRKATTITDNVNTYNEFQWRKRQITLNFTYRFNMKKEERGNRGNNEGGGMQYEG